MYKSHHETITRIESQSTGKCKLLPLHSYPSRLNPDRPKAPIHYGARHSHSHRTTLKCCLHTDHCICAIMLFSNCRPQAFFFPEQPVMSSANHKIFISKGLESSPHSSPWHGPVQSPCRVQVCSYPCSYKTC